MKEDTMKCHICGNEVHKDHEIEEITEEDKISRHLCSNECMMAMLFRIVGQIREDIRRMRE